MVVVVLMNEGRVPVPEGPVPEVWKCSFPNRQSQFTPHSSSTDFSPPANAVLLGRGAWRGVFSATNPFPRLPTNPSCPPSSRQVPLTDVTEGVLRDRRRPVSRYDQLQRDSWAEYVGSGKDPSPRPVSQRERNPQTRNVEQHLPSLSFPLPDGPSLGSGTLSLPPAKEQLLTGGVDDANEIRRRIVQPPAGLIRGSTSTPRMKGFAVDPSVYSRPGADEKQGWNYQSRDGRVRCEPLTAAFPSKKGDPADSPSRKRVREKLAREAGEQGEGPTVFGTKCLYGDLRFLLEELLSENCLGVFGEEGGHTETRTLAEQICGWGRGGAVGRGGMCNVVHCW